MNVDNKKCGGCTACCLALGVIVTEGGRLVQFSEEGKWCRYCDKNKGCRIYPNHPGACKNFTCLWLKMDWDIGLRPDNLGFVLYVEEGALWISESQQGEVDVPGVGDLVKTINKQGVVVGIRYLSGLCKVYEPGGSVVELHLTPELTQAMLPYLYPRR